MRDVAARIPDQASRLPAEARVAIANSLLDSLDAAVDVDADEAWQREIRERIRNLDSGATRLLSPA